MNSIGIFLYEELSHGILQSKYVEAVNVLLGTLRVSFNYSHYSGRSQLKYLNIYLRHGVTNLNLVLK